MKKISIIILLFGICLIIISLTLLNGKKEDMTKLKIDDLKISNLILKSENSFSFDIYNESNINVKNLNVNLYALNENKEIIMISEFLIENLKAKEKKEFEYTQPYIFETSPTEIYFKDYNKDEKMPNIGIESQLTESLIQLAKEVFTKEYDLSNKNSKVVITADDLKNKYKKDIGDLQKTEYNCSLSNSYVEIVWDNDTNEYDYMANIDCEAFYIN